MPRLGERTGLPSEFFDPENTGRIMESAAALMGESEVA
jgi:hypothetical protein